MGMYSRIYLDDKSGQVKLWDGDDAYIGVACQVPSHRAAHTYSIAMREGGFINVKNCTLHSWTSTPAYDIVFDKWGHRYIDGTCNSPTAEILGDKYHYSDV